MFKNFKRRFTNSERLSSNFLKETHRSVKQQHLEIIEVAQRLKIDVEEHRRMLNETLCSAAP